jgi:hypothetical protein
MTRQRRFTKEFAQEAIRLVDTSGRDLTGIIVNSADTLNLHVVCAGGSFSSSLRRSPDRPADNLGVRL